MPKDRTLTIRLDQKSYDALQAIANVTHRSRGAIIRMLLELAKELLHEPTAQNAQ